MLYVCLVVDGLVVGKIGIERSGCQSERSGSGQSSSTEGQRQGPGLGRQYRRQKTSLQSLGPFYDDVVSFRPKELWHKRCSMRLDRL